MGMFNKSDDMRIIMKHDENFLKTFSFQGLLSKNDNVKYNTNVLK